MQFQFVTVALAALVASAAAAGNSTNGTNSTSPTSPSSPSATETGAAFHNAVSGGLLGAAVAGGLALVL